MPRLAKLKRPRRPGVDAIYLEIHQTEWRLQSFAVGLHFKLKWTDASILKCRSLAAKKNR